MLIQGPGPTERKEERPAQRREMQMTVSAISGENPGLTAWSSGLTLTLSGLCGLLGGCHWKLWSRAGSRPKWRCCKWSCKTTKLKERGWSLLSSDCFGKRSGEAWGVMRKLGVGSAAAQLCACWWPQQAARRAPPRQAEGKEARRRKRWVTAMSSPLTWALSIQWLPYHLHDTVNTRCVHFPVAQLHSRQK